MQARAAGRGLLEGAGSGLAPAVLMSLPQCMAAEQTVMNMHAPADRLCRMKQAGLCKLAARVCTGAYLLRTVLMVLYCGDALNTKPHVIPFVDSAVTYIRYKENCGTVPNQSKQICLRGRYAICVST